MRRSASPPGWLPPLSEQQLVAGSPGANAWERISGAADPWAVFRQNRARGVGPGLWFAQQVISGVGPWDGCLCDRWDRQILMARSGLFSVVGRSCRRWHLGPGVYQAIQLSPGHLRRCDGRRQGFFNKAAATRQERQRSVESVGAGTGSSARSSLVLRGLSSIRGASESVEPSFGIQGSTGNGC